MAATIIQVRTLVNDRLPNNVFDDKEYDTILSIDDTIYGAATLAARMLSAHYALKIDTTVGDVAIKNSQKYDHYESLAAKYEKLGSSGKTKDAEFAAAGGGAPQLTGVSNAAIESVQDDDDRYKPAFYRGVMDNDSTDALVDTTGDNE